MFKELFKKKEEPKIMTPEELEKFVKPKPQETEAKIKFEEQSEEEKKLAEERRQAAIEKLREKIQKTN